MIATLVAALSLASSLALDVPYLPQTDALCGGAAAAMVFRYWGDAHADVQEFASLVDRRAGGIAKAIVAETGGQRPARGAHSPRRALERDPRRRLLVAGVVVRIAVREMRVTHTRALVEETAAAAAGHGVQAGDGEGAVGSGPDGLGFSAAAEEAGRVDGWKPSPRPLTHTLSPKGRGFRGSLSPLGRGPG